MLQGRTNFARDDLKLLEVVPGDDKKFQNISRPAYTNTVKQ